MAYVFRTYECPDCESRFELMQEAADDAPRFCIRCGADFGEDRPEPIPGTHSIGGSNAARAVDMTYNLLEQSAGITNLHDNLREGDVAAVMPELPNNAVGQLMKDAAKMGINYGWGGGAAAAGGNPGPIQAGPTTYSGPTNLALGAVQGDAGAQHAQLRGHLTRSGQINRG